MESIPFNIPTINARLIEKVTLNENKEDQFAQIWVDNKAKFAQIAIDSPKDGAVVVYVQNEQQTTVFVGTIFTNGKPQIVPLPLDSPIGHYTVGIMCNTKVHTGSFSIM